MTKYVLAMLHRLNAKVGEFYFSPATLEFFGAEQRHAELTETGFLYSEYRSKAPRDTEPWLAAMFDKDGRFIRSASGFTREEAVEAVTADVAP